MQLAAAEERQAATEAEVRDEVSAEMGELLRDMEAGYRVSMCAGKKPLFLWTHKMKHKQLCDIQARGVSSSAILAFVAL